MHTITTTVYTFDELDERAKERARDWWRSSSFSDSNDWDHVYADAERIGSLMGIEISQRTFKTVGGGSGSEPCIFFSGFSSQGDGACFEGCYRYKKGGVKAVMSEAPTDKELARIVKALQDVQRRHFYALTASCKHRGYYQHSGCMHVEVEDDRYRYRDIGDAEDDIAQLMRDFADWIYKQLENEYEYQNSTEVVDEMLKANQYTFTEEGKPA